jgi:hypothetical protein
MTSNGRAGYGYYGNYGNFTEASPSSFSAYTSRGVPVVPVVPVKPYPGLPRPACSALHSPHPAALAGLWAKPYRGQTLRPVSAAL